MAMSDAQKLEVEEAFQDGALKWLARWEEFESLRKTAPEKAQAKKPRKGKKSLDEEKRMQEASDRLHAKVRAAAEQMRRERGRQAAEVAEEEPPQKKAKAGAASQCDESAPPASALPGPERM
jgi:hypothetical protein